MHVERGRHQINLDQPAAPGGGAPEQGGHEPLDKMIPAGDIKRRESRWHGRFAIVSREPRHPRHGLNQQILSRFPYPGARGAIAGDGAIDDPGIQRANRFISQPDAFHYAGTKIVNYHVR